MIGNNLLEGYSVTVGSQLMVIVVISDLIGGGCAADVPHKRSAGSTRAARCATMASATRPVPSSSSSESDRCCYRQYRWAARHKDKRSDHSEQKVGTENFQHVHTSNLQRHDLIDGEQQRCDTA